MLFTQSKGSKAPLAMYLLLKMLCLRSSLTVRKGYALDMVQRVQSYTDIILTTQNALFKVQFDR